MSHSRPKLRHRIFIIDDHPIFRRALEGLLELQPDVQVCGTAASGSEALEVLPGMAADLVVLDLSMPGENGFELIGALRKTFPSMPLLAVSAYQEPSYAKQALEAGASGYIMKRADEEALLQAVRNAIAAAPVTLEFAAEPVIGKAAAR